MQFFRDKNIGNYIFNIKKNKKPFTIVLNDRECKMYIF